jgi:hypothetical protein
MTFADRIEAVKNALDIHKRKYSNKIISENLNIKLKSIIDDITNIRSYRNYFSHYCWMRSNDNKIFGTQLSGRLPKVGEKDKDSVVISNEKLENIYEKAYQLVESLSQVIDQLPELEEIMQLAKKSHYKPDK